MLYYHEIGSEIGEECENAANIRQKEADIRLKRHLYITGSHLSCHQKAQPFAVGTGGHPAKDADNATIWSVDRRVEALADEGTPILPLMDFAHYGDVFEFTEREASRAGLLEAIITVRGRKVLVAANDVRVAAGAWWPLSPKKIQRIQKMALVLHVPVIYLVECSGLYLPEQAASFPGADGAGAIFRMQAELSMAGIVQLAAVFGDSVAGGGYMPIISDCVVMTERANIFIGGAAIAAGAKNAFLPASAGGPDVQVHLSGSADERVPDDACAILRLREWVSLLPTSAANFYRISDDIPPRYPIEDLYSCIPENPGIPFDMHEVIARLVDGSLFAEISMATGTEIIAGIGHVHGLPVGIIANQTQHSVGETGELRPASILYREGIEKMTRFARDCAANGIPLLWIQDVAGFDIGYDAEKAGLLRLGAGLLYQNAENASNGLPQMTILLRKASGAGYYAMAGLPFENTLQISTALAREQVMEPSTLARAMFGRKIQKLENTPDFEGRDARLHSMKARMEALKQKVSEESSVIYAASHLATDEIVELSSLPEYIRAFLEMCYQSTHLKHKNARIWGF